MRWLSGWCGPGMPRHAGESSSPAPSPVPAGEHRAEVEAQAAQGLGAAGRQAVAALEAHGETAGHQLEQRPHLGHLGPGLLEHVEEALAGRHVVMQRAGEAGALPGAGGAPGRIEDDVVHERAEDIVAELDLTRIDALGVGPLLEAPQLRLHAGPQRHGLQLAAVAP